MNKKSKRTGFSQEDFHLLPFLLFQLDFFINFFYFISTSFSSILSKLFIKKMSILSLSKFVSFDAFFLLFQPLFSPVIVLFSIVILIITIHLFLFLENLYQLLCIFRYFGIPIPDLIFFFPFFFFLVINLDVKL